MYYLSQYDLGPVDMRRLRLTDGYSLHRVVYDLFEDSRQGGRSTSSGILFAHKGIRLGRLRLLILSDREPRQPGFGQIQTRVLPEAYLQASQYRFEIIINPTLRENSSRRLIPIRGRDAVAQWFMEKSPGWGFVTAAASLQVNDISVERFTKKGRELTIARAHLTGFLTVTDREAFVRAVQNGIGRAKAFGCGLLQVVPSN